MLFLRGFKKKPWNEKNEESDQVSLFETILHEYSPFSVINHQNRSTLPLKQLVTSSRTPIALKSATSQPLALPAPLEPSGNSATGTASFSTFEACDSSQDYSKESTGDIQQWRTPKGSERFWR